MTEDEAPHPKRAGHIRDARGRTVAQLDPITLRLLGGEEGISADVLEAMCARIGERMTWTELCLFGSPGVMHWVIRLTAIGLAVLLVSCVVLVIVRPAALVSAVPFLLPPSASLGFLYLLWVVARRTRCRRVAEIMLEFHRCPHCGYDLRMLRAAPEDGATVCPECGCAWALGLVGELCEHRG